MDHIAHLLAGSLGHWLYLTDSLAHWLTVSLAPLQVMLSIACLQVMLRVPPGSLSSEDDAAATWFQRLKAAAKQRANYNSTDLNPLGADKLVPAHLSPSLTVWCSISDHPDHQSLCAVSRRVNRYLIVW